MINFRGCTWRIIPGLVSAYFFYYHGDRKSPKDRVVGPLPFMAFVNGLYMGVILTTYKSWDDPPSNQVTR